MHVVQAETGTPLTTKVPADASATPRTHRRSIALLIAVAVIGYGLDQLTKAWAAASLDPWHPRELIGTLLQLHLTRNPGAAFSIATNATWLLTLIAVAVIVATIVVARRLRSRAWACALGLLIGGALGNLTDRVFRAPGGGEGHVVDFLELPHWPIFNVADMCVVTAACLIALLALVGVGVDGTRVTRDDADDDESRDDADTARDENDTDGDGERE